MQFHIFETEFSLGLVETLLHFLWQGLAIGLVMWITNGFVLQTRSNLRYRLNLFALMLMAACLPLTFFLLPNHRSESAPAGETVPALASNTSPSTGKGPVLVESADPPLYPTPEVSPQPPVVGSSSNEADPSLVSPRPTPGIEIAKIASTPSHPWINRIAPYATTIYVTGVVLMLLRLLLAVWGGQRLRRVAQAIDEPGLLANIQQLARRLGLQVAPVVATCSRITIPVVVGILKPMILLPPALVTGMSPDQLEAVLAHELAHLRRFDLAINLLQRLIEAVLFFHPAMWYVSRRVSIEREHRCDDTVMNNGCSRLTYADALLRMAEICTGTVGQPALESATALAATGHNSSEFKRRVLRVLGEEHGPPLRLTRGGLAIFSAMLISIIALPWAVQGGAEEEVSQAPIVPAADLSGPITDSKFIDSVAEQVAGLPFATDWQLENARQFARQITRENLSSDISEEDRRRILESLNDYVDAFRERHRGENRDNSYVRRPEDVRNLLWRLKLALIHKPLNDQEKAKLDAQMEELFKWVRTVPPYPNSKLTGEEVISKLNDRQSDPMEPLFKEPLPPEEFEAMMSKLLKKKLSMLSAEHYAVAEWFYTQVESSPDLVHLTGDPAEKSLSRGASNAEVHVGYQSTAVWSGNRNGMDAWSTFIDFSEAVPGIRSLDPPRAVIEQGDDAVREWVEESSYTNLGHITFDYEKRRLVGVRGTRLLELDVDSFIAADQLNGDVLKDRIRKQGRGEFSLPKPKSIDDLGHDETYDLFVGALTKEHNLYVLKIETVGTLSKMLWYRVRQHNPPYPDEVGDAPQYGPPGTTDRQPVGPRLPISSEGVQAPLGNPVPQLVDATTLELYNQYIAKVGKIETASIVAAIELVASRASGDDEFRTRLRQDFATSCEKDDQNVSPKLLALITKILYIPRRRDALATRRGKTDW